MSGCCALCGGRHFEPVLVASDRVVARSDDYAYGRCSQCALISLLPAPDPQQIQGFYPPDYGPSLAAPASSHPRSGRRLLAPRGGMRLLDVGCGAGALLARYRALGWEVRGIEPNPRAARACREQGLDVEQKSLFEADVPRHHFDVILLHHVVEHVARPVAALQRARDALAPDGVIAVVTPNAGGLGFRSFGPCWYALDAPRHLHLFDAGTLRSLAERAGLRVRALATDASARVLTASFHWARTQGRVLPAQLAAREAALERARRSQPSRTLRRLASPVAHVAAWLGFGETLRAELVAPEGGDA